MDTPPGEPRLAMTGSAPVIDLPARMERALNDYAPGFRPWGPDDYRAEILRHLEPPESTPLFGATGDFDGDGTTDVVLQGAVDGHEVLFVLRSRAGSVEVEEIERRPLPGAGVDRKLSHYLRRVDPGTVAVPDELAPPGDDSLRLAHPAFELVIEGQASLLFRWTGDGFERVVTAD